MKLSTILIFWISLCVKCSLTIGESTVNYQSFLSRISDIEEFIRNQQRQINGLSLTVERQTAEITDLKRKLSALEQNFDHTKGTVLNIQRITRRTIKAYDETDHEYPELKTGVSNDRPEVEEFRKERLLLPSSNSGLQIAFYAYMTQREPIGFHKVMIFNFVQTNLGHAYNNHTGTFTAPTNGLYTFSCSLYPSHLSRGNFRFMLNDDVIATMFADSDGSNWDITASGNTVVLHLQQGDDVYIRSSSKSEYPDGNVNSLEGSAYAKSSFTGWLISSDA